MLTAESAATEREAALAARGVAVVRLPATDADPDVPLDLRSVLAELAKRDIMSVLVEAGSALNGALLRADLVDRVVLYFAEAELGLDAIPFARGFDSPYAVQQRLSQVTRAAFPSDVAANGDDIRVAGYLHDPWA